MSHQSIRFSAKTRRKLSIRGDVLAHNVARERAALIDLAERDEYDELRWMRERERDRIVAGMSESERRDYRTIGGKVPHSTPTNVGRKKES